MTDVSAQSLLHQRSEPLLRYRSATDVGLRMRLAKGIRTIERELDRRHAGGYIERLEVAW